MAYVDKQPLSHRLANLGTAGLIELGIGIALVAGLSTTFVADSPVPQITATNYPSDPLPTPPPPDDPQPQPQPKDTIAQFPNPPTPWEQPKLPDFPTQDSTGTPFDGPTGLATPNPPRETPKPAFKAVSAKPSNNASRWVTDADYPSNDLRKGNQGTTGFRVIVGSDGRVQACEVTRSSGFEGLDDATCNKVERRARFNPATDETGAKVVGSYVGSVVWRIPR